MRPGSNQDGSTDEDGVRKWDGEGLPDALHMPDRRRLLQAIGAAGAAGLAGCAGNRGEETGTGTEPPAEATATPTPSPTRSDTPTPEPETRQVTGDYVVGDSTGVTTLNWIQVADAPTSNRVGLTLDGAYALTTDQEVFPLWADISTDDKKTYTVSLRENLQWGGGYGEMTAEDWVYMITEVFQREDNWAGYTSQSDWQQTREGEQQFYPVEQTGTYEFEIRLFNVDPAFPQKPIMWGAYCLPKGLLEKYVPARDASSDEKSSASQNLKKDEEIQTLAYAGNLGPYTFDTWEREAEFVATRSEDYYVRDAFANDDKFGNLTEAWGGAPYFESYTYRVIPEESTRLSALKTGEITSTGIPDTKVKQFETDESVSVVKAPQPFNTLLIYNQRENSSFAEGFRNRSIRQALSFVLDKEAIVENIYRGNATVAHTFQPQYSNWYSDDRVRESGVGETYDPDRARSMLADNLGDVPFSYDGDTLVNADGEQVTLKLVYPTGTQTTKTTCEYVKQQYEQSLGMAVELKGVKFNTLIGKYARNSVKNNDIDTNGEGSDWNSGPFNAGSRRESVSAESWDLQYGIVFNTYPRTPTSTSTFWQKKSPTNYFGYYPSVDMATLYEEASTTTDDSVRQDRLSRIFGALSEDQPCNFISFSTSIAGFQDEISGPEPEFGYGWDSNVWFAENPIDADPG